MINLENLKIEQSEESLARHLEELRKRAIFSILVLTFCSIVSYFFSNEIFSFLIHPIAAVSQKVYFVSPYDAFLVKLQISFWSGVILASPLLFSQVWFFIKPGLYVREKSFFLFFLAISVGLFLIGLSLAIFAVIPTTIQFFLSFSTPELLPLISIQQYLSFYVWMSLAFGLSFEAPIFLVGLVRFGVFELQQLKSMRAYIVVGIFIFAAVITPSPDPFSQCLLAFPMWFLFEVSLIAARFVKRP